MSSIEGLGSFFENWYTMDPIPGILEVVEVPVCPWSSPSTVQPQCSAVVVITKSVQ
jgi:hypothetical protein